MKRPQVGDHVAVYSGSFYGARGHVLKVIGVMAYVRVGDAARKIFGRDVVCVNISDFEVVS